MKNNINICIMIRKENIEKNTLQKLSRRLISKLCSGLCTVLHSAVIRILTDRGKRLAKIQILPIFTVCGVAGLKLVVPGGMQPLRTCPHHEG